MPRGRPKKRIYKAKVVEMDQIDDDSAENHQPNQPAAPPKPDLELEPSSPKQIKLTRKGAKGKKVVPVKQKSPTQVVKCVSTATPHLGHLQTSSSSSSSNRVLSTINDGTIVSLDMASLNLIRSLVRPIEVDDDDCQIVMPPVDAIESNSDTTYYFIESATNVETSDLMEKAFNCLISHRRSAEWLPEENFPASLKNVEGGNFALVLPAFDGALYEVIRNNHPTWKLLSPIAILNFLDRHLPERDYPIMDVSMERCFVTLSGLPKEDKLDLEEKIRQMSGQISTSLESRTTHIVASTWNTDKCLYSRRNGGYPSVMSPQWVESHWDNIKIRSTNASDLSLNICHRLPIFTGFVFCGANLSQSMSDDLRYLVMDEGGIYEKHLDSYRTTHLVIIKKEGPEYERALDSDRIKIVSPEWIHESIAEGYPLPEQDASVRKLVNRMIGKMMDFVGVPFNSYADSRNRTKFHRSKSDHIKVPGSPEPVEEETDHEMGSDED